MEMNSIIKGGYDMRACSARVMFLVVMLALTACGKGPELSDAEYVSRAKEFQDKGDIRAAVIELKNALRKNPDNVEGRWILGQIYVETGNGASAEKELLRARELGLAESAVAVPLARALLLQASYARVLAEIKPTQDMAPREQAWVHALHGEAHLGKAQPEEALQDFERAIALDATLPYGYIGKAQLSLVKRDLAATRGWVDQALKVDPKSAEAWRFMGMLERAADNAAAAEQAYSKAIDYGHNNTSDRLSRALVRIQLKNFKGAEEDVAILERTAADFPGTHYARGLLEMENKQYAKAQNAFEQALKRNPDYVPAMFALGNAHYVQGNYSTAEEQLTRVLGKAPGHDEAARLLGLLRVRKQDLAGAESVLAPVLARHPDDALTLRLMSAIAMAGGDTKRGMQYVQRATAQAPESGHARAQLGLSLLSAGDQSAGLQELEKAVALDPAAQQLDMILIVNYLRAGKFDQALTAAQALHKKQADSPLPLNVIGGIYLSQGKEQQAREAFNEALRLAPGDPSASHNLAVMAGKAGKADEAKRLYEEAIKRHPEQLRTVVQLAELELRMGENQAAQERLQRAIKDNPKALEPRLLLGMYYLNRGQAVEALNLANEVKESYPKHPVLLLLMGEAHLALNDSTNAVPDLTRLVEVSPRSAQAHYLLARAYAETNNSSKSFRELKETLRLDPNHLLAKISMSRSMMLGGDPKGASRLLAELKKSYPESPQVFAHEGWLAMQQQRPRDAVTAFNEALKRAPIDEFAISLSLAQARAGDKAGSVATLENWLKQHPDDALVHYNLANLYLASNREKEARAAFEKVVKQRPKDAMALNTLAWLLRKSNPTEALQLGERAFAEAPSNPAVMDTLGMIYLDQGQGERALRLLSDAAKTSNSPEVDYHYAVALSRTGDKAKAQQVLSSLLKGKPSFSELADARALLNSLSGSSE